MGGSVPSLDEIGIKAEDELLPNFQGEVAQLLGRKQRHFPGAQPVSFSRRHIQELKSKDYYVCEKSDGIRSLLWFTQDSPDKDYAELHYLIDRKNNYYYIPGLHFPRPAPSGSKDDDPEWDSHHTDTILDGELLWDVYDEGSQGERKILKYLVFDCLVLDGHSLLSRTLDKRLAHFRDAILTPYTKLCRRFPEDTENFVFKVEEKVTQKSYGTEMMFRDVLPGLKHGSDGLIFTCRETPYHFGTDEHILKWKPAHENTVDFRLDLRFPPLLEDEEEEQEGHGANGANGAAAAATQDDPHETQHDYDYDAMPAFRLLVNGGTGVTETEYATLFATTDEWERMKAWSVEHDNGLDGQVIECHKDSQGRWRFNRFRDDKSDANHISVVEKVLESIEDAVDEQELITEAYGIRKAWKAREAAAEKERGSLRQPVKR